MVGKRRKHVTQHGVRRDKLVRAAYDVIARKGFEGLRLREVATKAGIDHSTLHHHFPTKSALIAAVLDYATEQFRRPGRRDGETPSTLGEHLSFLTTMIVERPELHTVLREFDLHAARNRRVQSIIARSEKGWRQRLATRIRRANADHRLPSALDPSTGAELVIAVVKGASLNPRAAAKIMSLFEQLLFQPFNNDQPRNRR